MQFYNFAVTLCVRIKSLGVILMPVLCNGYHCFYRRTVKTLRSLHICILVCRLWRYQVTRLVS